MYLPAILLLALPLLSAATGPYFYTTVHPSTDSNCTGPPHIIYAQHTPQYNASECVPPLYTPFACTLQNGVYVSAFCSSTAPPAYAESFVSAPVSYFGEIEYSNSCKAGNEIIWTYIRIGWCVHAGSATIPVGQGDSITSTTGWYVQVNETGFIVEQYASNTCSGSASWSSFRSFKSAKTCPAPVHGATQRDVLLAYKAPTGPDAYHYTTTHTDASCAAAPNIVYVKKVYGPIALCTADSLYAPFGCTAANGVYHTAFCAETLPPAFVDALAGVTYFGEIQYIRACESGKELIWTYIKTDTCVHSGLPYTPVGQGDSITSTGGSIYAANATYFTVKQYYGDIPCEKEPTYVGYRNRSVAQACSVAIHGSTQLDVLVRGTGVSTPTPTPTPTAWN
ncbi:hypothetical protein SeMB42_g05191 [Synchytrium endobioticum]|uniref:Uncharacterized protein n=1 Tax=Synchytrium endobioticum TaxID=286115 RepID=A0A507CT91_9FUNG|nr:hypothetical protein SeLEV6574_g06817 [Synchytrium endobioticum]TPX42281.1 hypothetical protein SeMB42_g05191 [Synchytrium endobioticum]